MKQTTTQPTNLLEAIRYFADPAVSTAYVASLRWGDTVICPTCGRTDVSFLASQQRWQCKSAHPKRQFSVKVGTIFEDSPLGLDKWLPAVWMIVNAKNGVSSYEIARSLSVTQKSAWFMMQRIRKAMDQGGIGKLEDVVEGDETYVGGKAQQRNLYANKSVIIGVVEKKKGAGRAKAFATKQADATVALRFLDENVQAGATLHTDESRIYHRARRNFDHAAVNHSKLEYVRGYVHTNTIEGVWNLFKRSYKGTYTHLSAKHMNDYVQEHMYRYNTRQMSDGERFAAWFRNVGVRVTYAELVK